MLSVLCFGDFLLNDVENKNINEKYRFLSGEDAIYFIKIVQFLWSFHKL